MMMPWFGGCCGYGSFGWIGLLLNLIITLALIGGIAALAIWLVRRLSAGDSGESSHEDHAQAQPSPRELLKIRYARGEITREQYLQMLDDLS